MLTPGALHEDHLGLEWAQQPRKSTTLNLLADQIKAAFPTSVVAEQQYKVDRTLIVMIEGHKVGIETQGDPGSRLGVSLRRFVDAGCEVIVCACRSRGDTMELVKAVEERGYAVQWFAKSKSADVADQLSDNADVARAVYEAVLRAIGK